MQNGIIIKTGNFSDQDIRHGTAFRHSGKFPGTRSSRDHNDTGNRSAQHPRLGGINDMIVVLIERRHGENMLISKVTFDVDRDLRYEIIRFAGIDLRIEKNQFRNIIFRFQLARSGKVTVLLRTVQNPLPGLQADTPVSGERTGNRGDRHPRFLCKLLNRDPVSHLSDPSVFANNVPLYNKKSSATEKICCENIYTKKKGKFPV